MVALLVLGAVAATLGLVILPLLLPWPQRLRWLIASSTVPDPFGPGGLSTGPTFREVTIEAVERGTDGFAVRLAVVGSDERLLRWGPPTAEVARQLNRWAYSGTPLLLAATGNDEQSLHSGTTCVAGLRATGPCPSHAPQRSG